MTSAQASSSSTSSLVVRLIVGEGVNAGVHADIREGFYMIGRDRECQIRPKTRSVSQRHCLVQHAANTVRVFDLNSDEGTFVNDEQLPPHRWRVLNHGDRLRCGRYWFEVAIYQPLPDGTSDSGDIESPEPANPSESNSEIDLFTDDQWAPPLDASELPAATSQETDFGLSAEERKLDQSTPKSTPSSRPVRAPLPKPKIRSGSSWPRFNLSMSTEFSWQVIAAALVAIIVIGYAGWSVSSLFRSPQVKVLRQPD